MILVYHEKQAEKYANHLTDQGLTKVVYARSEQEVSEWLDRVEILFAWKFPAHLYQKMPKLRWVQWMGAGVEDVVRALPESVLLTRIVGQFGKVMAEYVFTWLLHEYQGVSRFLEAKASREWNPKRPESLAGKTLGVAGLGSIGQEVIKLGKAFGMKTIGLSRTGSQEKIVEQHFFPDKWVDFASLVDVLVIVLPHTDETDKVVNQEVLAAMSPSSIVVNIGRGKTVDQEALLARIQSRKLRAAILDVFEEEPLPVDHPFWEMPQVYITPHVSGPSLSRDVSQFFIENYERLESGRPLLGLVDRHQGY